MSGGEKEWLDSGAYVVRICPKCRCIQDGEVWEAHTSDCPNRGKTFAIEELKVVPAGAGDGPSGERVLDAAGAVLRGFPGWGRLRPHPADYLRQNRDRILREAGQGGTDG